MTPIRSKFVLAASAAFAAVFLWAGAASAHSAGALTAPGFLTGFAHPLGGADHVLAMLAVGVLAVAGGTRLWVFPAAFVAAMIAGFAAAAGLALPFVETGIAVSLIALGLATVLIGRAPVWALGGLVTVCAVLHGHAHGGEAGALANPLAFVAGFATATALLHAAGIGFGWLLCRSQLTAGAGYGLAAAGVLFVAGL